MSFIKCLLIVFIISITQLLTVINADTYEECEGVAAETYVASPDSCAAYIYCDGDDSIMDECDEGQYFDAENIACDAKENVYCPLDDVEGGEEEPEEPEEPEEVITTTLAPTTLAPTIAPDANGTTPMDILNIPPVIKDSCPATDDPNQIVLIANSNSCSDYYVCYHGHALEMHCMDHLHFNTLTGKCDFPENSNCKINNQPPLATNKCLPHVTDFFPHPQKCNYFFYCIKGYQTLQQCPFYYGWDIERRTCVHMSQVKCHYNAH